MRQQFFHKSEEIGPGPDLRFSAQADKEWRVWIWSWSGIACILSVLFVTFSSSFCSQSSAAEPLDFLVPVPDAMPDSRVTASHQLASPQPSQREPFAVGTRPVARQSPISQEFPVANFDGQSPAQYYSEQISSNSHATEYVSADEFHSHEECGADRHCDPARWHCCPESNLLHFRAEHLQWWSSGMELPPLATLSPPGTPVNQAGVLGVPGTSILYGGREIFDGSLPGGRYTATYWWDQCSPLAIEAEYFGIFHAEQAFQAGSPTDIVSRPFINALSGLEDAELVSFPGLLEGTTSAIAHTELHSAAARLRFDFYHRNSAFDLDWKDRWLTRWTASLGYRYAQLEEDLTIREDLTDPAPPPIDFDIRDAFETENHFHGGQLGLAGEFEDGRWSLDVDAKLSIGRHRQTVRIDGSTIITTLGVAQPFPGGLLTQTTNIGAFKRDRLTVLPEFGASIGYRLRENVRLVAGYRLFFWPKVVRPGDQIDRVVNPNLLAPAVPPVAGPQRPRFAFREDDFLGQALSFGVEVNW